MARAVVRPAGMAEGLIKGSEGARGVRSVKGSVRLLYTQPWNTGSEGGLFRPRVICTARSSRDKLAFSPPVVTNSKLYQRVTSMITIINKVQSKHESVRVVQVLRLPHKVTPMIASSNN